MWGLSREVMLRRTRDIGLKGEMWESVVRAQ